MITITCSNENDTSNAPRNKIFLNTRLYDFNNEIYNKL